LGIYIDGTPTTSGRHSMRKLMLVTAGVAMFATTGLAVARGFDEGKNATAVAGTFTATTVGNSQTRTCTTTDGKTISTTNATYTGTATSSAADLTGNATVQLRSTINTTDGVGVATGKLKIAATGGDTVAHFDAVYDKGALAGLASGHAATPHAALLANLSATFSATGGLTDGKLGGGTAGGSAVETGPARCAPSKASSETVTAHGSITAVSTTSITAAGVQCTIPSTLAGKLSSLLTLGARAEIKCSVAGGVNTLVRASAQKH
jgi:stage V sporulation protein SpoVS